MDRHLPKLHRTEPEGPGRLRLVRPGLWATPDEPLGGPANTCGFLIERSEGNAFVYSSSRIADYYEHLDELGGVGMILLNHEDEAIPHVSTLAERYNAPVRAHDLEVEPCHVKGVRAIDPFHGDTTFGPDLEAIHAPGHTPGTTAYLWHNPRDDQRYLFTGDTFSNFTIDNFRAVLRFHDYGDNEADVRRTLPRLRETESDVLVPGLASGAIHAYRWNINERHRLIDHALAQLPQD